MELTLRDDFAQWTQRLLDPADASALAKWKPAWLPAAVSVEWRR